MVVFVTRNSNIWAVVVKIWSMHPMVSTSARGLTVIYIGVVRVRRERGEPRKKGIM